MAETYSVSVTAADLGNTKHANVLTIGDSGAATHDKRLQSMRLNTPILCKNPDGSQSWYTIDDSLFWMGQHTLKRLY